MYENSRCPSPFPPRGLIPRPRREPPLPVVGNDWPDCQRTFRPSPTLFIIVPRPPAALRFRRPTTALPCPLPFDRRIPRDRVADIVRCVSAPAFVVTERPATAGRHSTPPSVNAA